MKSAHVPLLFLLAVSCYGDELQEVMLATSLRAHFHASGVFLVHSTDFSTHQRSVRFLKYLSNAGVSASSPDISQIRKFKSETSKSLLVLNEDLKKVMNSVIGSQFVWLVLQRRNSMLVELLKDISIPFDCEFLVASPITEGGFNLTEVYRVSDEFPLQIHNFGSWSSAKGLSVSVGSLYSRRNNLQGLQLRTGDLKYMSIKKLLQVRNICFSLQKKMTPSSEFFNEIWKSLERSLNFTSLYVMAPDNSFGSRSKNGSWSGVMGMLQRRDVVASNIALMASASRLLTVDFSVPVLDIKTFLLMRQPDFSVPKWNAYFMSLSTHVWWTILATVFLGAFCAAITGHCNQPLLMVFGAFCQQGQDVLQKPTSVRCILMTSHLTALVLMVCYSGSLVSHLAMQQPELPFSNFEEFLDDDVYELGMIPMSAKLDYFKKSKQPVLRRIYKKKVSAKESRLPKSEAEGVKRICSRDYVHVIASHNLMDVGHLVHCQVTPIPDAFFPGVIAFAITKGSPYLGIFNHKLRTMRASGVLNGLAKRYSFDFSKSRTSAKNPLSFSEVAAVFCCLGLGMVISILIFVLEVLVKWWSVRQKNYG
ncbi:Ionotropic receptor 134 [Blattella germanica]|nr:Ionotropic receptor 134 [Blattella germanica]